MKSILDSFILGSPERMHNSNKDLETTFAILKFIWTIKIPPSLFYPWALKDIDLHSPVLEQIH